MKSICSFPRVLIFRGYVDFRKRRRTLAAIVQDEIKEDPFSSTLFLFLNRRRDCIRALYWDKTGFAMWEKELEKDKFPWPRQLPREGCMTLQNQQVEWLLAGVDFWKLRPHAELEYSRVF